MGHLGMSALQSSGKRQPDAQYLAGMKNFENAVRYFQKQQYDKAREGFAKLLEASSPEVADRARAYLRLCEKKLGQRAGTPKTAQEFYDLGVAHLNSRNLDAALEALNKADALDPNRDHIRYALAVGHALQGNIDAAFEHLKAAIDLQPKIRFQARHDEDLVSLTADPRFRRLLSSTGATLSRKTA